MTNLKTIILTLRMDFAIVKKKKIPCQKNGYQRPHSETLTQSNEQIFCIFDTIQVRKIIID